MKSELLQWLGCPKCGSSLTVVPNQREDEVIREGVMKCSGCGSTYGIDGYVPRFVESESYVSSFGFEWLQFRRTQLDSINGRMESEERLKQSADFPLTDFEGKLVLDAGCGMGRFMEVALKYGATVVGVDMSHSVEAAFENVGLQSRAHIIQADLSRLPLKKGIFDFIYCLGVLHHTHAPKDIFSQLVDNLKPGGKISITLYSGYNKVYVSSTNMWRRFTKLMPQWALYYLSYLSVPLYYLYRIPVLGLPFQGIFPISMHSNPEWRILDTFDCYSPRYQSFHTHFEVYQWFKESGLKNIGVLTPAKPLGKF